MTDTLAQGNAEISESLARITRIREKLPSHGLFGDMDWLLSPQPFPISPVLAGEFESLGRVLLQFYRALNLLYRQSVSGKQPSWVAAYLDQGKPASLIDLQRENAYKNAIPRVIRPDVLLMDEGFIITELDSVPGGIGLTAWLNQVYQTENPSNSVIGGASGMLEKFAGIFGETKLVQILVSEESATYRPEMEWLAGQLGPEKFKVIDASWKNFPEHSAVYRFFELFDLANVPAAEQIFKLGAEKKLLVTPPAKPIFEEKLSFALLWNRNLRSFWRQELGESFFARLQKIIPYTWVIDPGPIPPHAAIPELGLTDWNQLKNYSQKERDLILKVSGYSEEAWGARGVYLGSDLPQAEWAAAIDKAIESFGRSPYVLQRYHKPGLFRSTYAPPGGDLLEMNGRVRLCPYYFVQGENDRSRAELGGILATICPPDKKIIHGMRDAILSPCMIKN